MSSKYKYGDHVPTSALCTRLDELSNAVTNGKESVAREFTVRIPAELDRDADLVLSQAVIRLKAYEAELAALRKDNVRLQTQNDRLIAMQIEQAKPASAETSGITVGGRGR